MAFYKHYPLRLSPDVIWLTVLQGLAKHIDKDPESQRSNFINFKGKKTLTVIREEFIRGSPNNDWTSVGTEFTGFIASQIGDDKVDTMSCNFSTSNESDQLCAQIALMDTVKHYFNYDMLCGCGIPSIELMGTTHDWVKLREKANSLNQYGLDWWTAELFPVLDQFVLAAQGQPDVMFWKNICNIYGASGFWQNYVSGWIQVLFPYTTSGNKNDVISEWRKHYENGSGNETEEYNKGLTPQFSMTDIYFGNADISKVGHGLKLEMIPAGISQAPLNYHDMITNKSYEYSFNGGIVGILQNKDTRSLEPISGWAILDHGEKIE